MRFLFFTILLFFTLFLTEIKATDLSNINYKEYNLSGIYKKELMPGNYYWIWEFNIYNGKIFNLLSGDSSYDVMEKFPDGYNELTTKNGSYIKVNVANGNINEFSILSNKIEFIKNEKKVANDDYCFKAMFTVIDYFTYNREKLNIVNLKIKLKNGEIKNLSNSSFFVYKYGNNYLMLDLLDLADEMWNILNEIDDKIDSLNENYTYKSKNLIFEIKSKIVKLFKTLAV